MKALSISFGMDDFGRLTSGNLSEGFNYEVFSMKLHTTLVRLPVDYSTFGKVLA